MEFPRIFQTDSRSRSVGRNCDAAKICNILAVVLVLSSQVPTIASPSQKQVRSVVGIIRAQRKSPSSTVSQLSSGEEMGADATGKIENLIDKVVRDKIHHDSITGLAITVADHGSPVFSRCYGYADVARKEQVTPRTVFALASLTKLFTALAMMMLVENKALRLNDCAARYLSGFPSDWKDVHIIHLLSHTSGLPVESRNSLPWSGSYREITVRPRSFLAGERSEYNNIGFVIAGKIIEQRSRQKLSRFFDSHIFCPLKMNDTTIPSTLFPAALATGYRIEKGNVIAHKNYQPWVSMGGSAGVTSTMKDLELFEEELCKRKLLRPQTYAQMYRPVSLSSGSPSGWNCGWELTNTPAGTVFRKNGNIGGYSSWYARGVKDDFSVIILSNTGDIKFADLDAQIRQIWRRSNAN